MDRLDQHRRTSRFDIDIADCAQAHSKTGVKVVQQTFGRSFAQLLLNHEEQIGFYGFQLEMSFIANYV